MYWTPFSSGAPDGSTERVRMVMNSCFIGMSITVDRWMSTPIAHQYAVVVTWLVQKAIVRTDLAGEAQDSGWIQTRFFYIGTERTATKKQPRSVPYGPTRSNRVKTRSEARLYTRYLIPGNP